MIAKIAGSDHVRRPFPIKGGFLDLYNINPFIDEGTSYTGLKTGYTDAAGRCYVTTAERGGRELGVVLLDSPNPLEQVPKLLDLGAKA
jgi:D-alanyl-D-alanine carboxypeptidase